MRLLALLLILTQLGCATVTGTRAAALTATAADVATTIVQLKHGAIEVNPIYGRHPTPARVTVVGAAVTLAVWYLMRDAAPRTQRIVWSAVAVFRFGAVAWNVSQPKGVRP